jgi:hypothetical protein
MHLLMKKSNVLVVAVQKGKSRESDSKPLFHIQQSFFEATDSLFPLLSCRSFITRVKCKTTHLQLTLTVRSGNLNIALMLRVVSLRVARIDLIQHGSAFRGFWLGTQDNDG